MMSMNGFTLGLFFPKQDSVRPAKDASVPTIKDCPPKTLISSLTTDDDADRPAPLSLYAHRFF